MDSVHFLNIEYLMLRLQHAFSGLVAFFTGTSVDPVTGTVTQDQVGSHLLLTLSFTAEQIAIGGMALAVILLGLSVWVRIKLEVVEHEGFHGRDAQYHVHTDIASVGFVEAAEGAVAEILSHPNLNTLRWNGIMSLSSSVNESDWRRAIMEADIMLGQLLDNQGYRGSSIGDKLKDANPLQFRTLDLAWKAHKVRNDIAHGGEGFHLSERDTRGTIDQFRQVFDEFKFI